MREIRQKVEEIGQLNYVTISGLNEGEKAFLPYFLSQKTVVICPDEKSVEIYKDTLTRLGKRVLSLEQKLPMLISFNESSSGIYREYYQVLSSLASHDYDVVLLTPDCLFQKLPNKEFIKNHYIKIDKQSTYNLQDLTNILISLGYQRKEIVFEKGEFALRGDILDIFLTNEENPIRINFFDDQIESIFYYDKTNFKHLKEEDSVEIICNSFLDFSNVDKQNLIENIKKDMEKLKISSQSMLRISEIASLQFEMLNNQMTNISSTFYLPYLDYFNASFFDYFDIKTKIIIDEPKLIYDKLLSTNDFVIDNFLNLSLAGEFLPKHLDFYLKSKDIIDNIKAFDLIAFARLVSQNKFFKSDNIINFFCPNIGSFVGKNIELISLVDEYIKNKYTVVISLGNALISNKIQNVLEDKKLSFVKIDNLKDIQNGKINLLQNGLNYTVHFEMEKLLIVGNKDIIQQTSSFQKVEVDKPKFLPKVGDYVVHETHGIGKCVGIKNIKITNVARDYIIIEYFGGDILYVPSENADMLSAFIGENEPKCNKIGGAEFYKTKQKVKKSLKQLATDLLQIYGKRLNGKGFVYSKDTPLQQDFENSFEYEYTDDQIKALNEIKADMESTKIMDRLLCGDVGFGKTEVALATAFKAITDGKQVAIICPTTILCEQHYATAVARMKDFFVKVACFNRFRSASEQKQILKDLKEGNINLICGTHKLLSKNVVFKDLGLIIIDEEQRFGVEDKDKLKKIKENVDVLSLSATPIPRTLYMSLVGIRDVSFLSTAPKRRKKTQTSVIDYSDSLLINACQKELNRGGQVLIVYNKVASITSFYRHICYLLPNVKIGFAHGQMPPKILEQAIYDLYSRQTQILISTVLIENGIDLPYANTLFVVDADKLGLSQLYQLRGRIGRSDIEAYAYFSFSKDKVLTQEAYKRLDALMEFSDFGSGYKIAMRDLEIRGAGDVLGCNQHGHMQQVGYDLYVKLLGEVVREIKGEKVEQLKEVKINIDISAYVPDTYISSSQARIEVYTKISKISSLEDYQVVQKEIAETYGSLPNCVQHLCKIGLIKNLAQQLNISKIIINDFGSKIYFYDEVKTSNLFEYLKKPSVDYALNFDKIVALSLKKQDTLQKNQESLINLLIKLVQIDNK